MNNTGLDLRLKDLVSTLYHIFVMWPQLSHLHSLNLSIIPIKWGDNSSTCPITAVKNNLDSVCKNATPTVSRVQK